MYTLRSKGAKWHLLGLFALSLYWHPQKVLQRTLISKSVYRHSTRVYCSSIIMLTFCHVIIIIILTFYMFQILHIIIIIILTFYMFQINIVTHNGRDFRDAREKRFVRDPEGRNRARNIDKAARKMFPLAFLSFNLIYWLAYILG